MNIYKHHIPVLIFIIFSASSIFGQGFSNTYTSWPVTGIEGKNLETPGSSTESYYVFDINGDKIVDLVHTSYNNLNFGTTGNYYWKVYMGASTGFSTTVTNWHIPDNFAIIKLSETPGSSTAAYTTMDINGDDKIDIVYTSLNYTPFGSTGNYYWKVYLNTGSGFSNTFTQWKTNGEYNYYQLPGASIGGFNTFDIDGDKKPDLVYSSYNNAVYGTTGNYYWQVYLGTASGFSGTAIQWTIPDPIPYKTSNTWGTGQYGYTTFDINGDGKSDLVYHSYNQAVFGSTGNYYWKVYLGGATGFSTTVTNWSVPTAYSAQYSEIWGANSYGYTTFDINGDNKSDLVFHSYNQAVFGTTGNYYWKVYLGGATGFSSTVTNWSVPDPLIRQMSETWGSLSYAYSTYDINGDNKSDLIIHSYNYNPFNTVSNYYWKVYLNTSVISGSLNPIIEHNLKIYPNPVIESLTLYNDKFSGEAKYSIRDNNGIEISNGKISSATQTIDISNLSPGIYFIQIGEESQLSEKFIVR